MNTEYNLDISSKTPLALPKGWMRLGLASLIIAGIFSILLVLSRVPQAQHFIPWLDFFHTSIVIHVDMSVLIWFLSYSSMVWTLTTKRLNSSLGWIALALSSSGTLIIGISPFIGAGDPLMNNYVPVLRHPIFFTGLVLFGLGILIQVTFGLVPDRLNKSPQETTLRLGSYSALLITAVAIGALAWSYLEVPASTEDHSYFEYLFWGSGHTLQFAYTQIMLVGWIWLYAATNRPAVAGSGIFNGLIILGALPVLLVPVIYLVHGSFSLEYRHEFTRLMRLGGGLAAAPLGLLLLYGLFRHKQKLSAEQKPIHNALLTSILLFGAGGILGFLTHGVNTIIPAHYHGSIVGVTLALMGLTYYLLPKFGFKTPDTKLAARQPYIYAGGQFIHISSLAVAGAMGIQRKTAGAAQGLDTMTVKAVMGIMGLGGLIAIIGGIIFLIVTIRCMLNGQKPTE